MSQIVKAPVRYTPSLETVGPDEQDTHDRLNEKFETILETTSKDYGHAVRSVHAKSHAILSGTLTVHGNLSPEYAQGLFATPGTHDATLRISTNPGDLLDDSISVPRGLALKLYGVEGDRLRDAEGTTQDFILVNAPVFAAATAEKFLGNLKLLAATTDKAEWAKKALSAVFRTAERALEAFGGESGFLKTLGGEPNTHPLGQTYFSAAAFRYGDHVAKFQLVPVAPHMTALADETINATGRPDAIREAMRASVIEGEAVWEFRVQLLRDIDEQPVEDASVEWPEAVSPFVTVATLRADPQVAWSHERARIVDDGLRFSVWTGLEAHRPLGSVNRARKSAYRLSSDFRGTFNGCPIHEPATAPDLTDAVM